LAADETRRAAVLDAACGDDAQLRTEVESLLKAHRDAGGFLESGQMGALPLVAGAAPPLEAGVRVAGYVVQRVLGVGGMGVVYVAEQDRPHRTVALKLIRQGAASAGLLRRFEHEAEVLGRLHHPGIAQIFEAGATEVPGRGPTPFIAMELIQGKALTEHGKGLQIREVVDIMARVCEAVHHAHQRGVIHRDLKPHNILVDAQGQPKVVDFGVARGVDAGVTMQTAGTGAGQIVGTLQYMSPEQVRADPDEVDTRSDVYALGVMLYELLTGRMPHDLTDRTLPEAARLICDTDPARIGTIDKTLRGDLDVMVAKALEKDKTRRYGSAAAVAEDLRRYLEGRPIRARDDSALYVMGKQLRRYAGIAGASAASIAALAFFAAYAWHQSGRYERVAKSEEHAKTDALEALKAAKTARTQADETAARLKVELASSTVERGRLLGRTGNLAAAEAMIWPAHAENPDSKQTHWALWELYSREPCLATVKAHEGGLRALATAPVGRVMYSAGDDGVVRIWDLPTGRVTGELQGDEGRGVPVQDLCVSADGANVGIARADGTVAVVDAGTGRQWWSAKAHPGGAHALVFSPDGTRIASGGADRRVRVWDAMSGSSRAETGEQQSEIKRLAWSPDGRTIAVSGEAPETRVLLWDSEAGSEPTVLAGHSGVVFSLAFSPDGKVLTSGGTDREIRLWDAEQHDDLGKLDAPNGTIRSLHFAGNGTLMAAGWFSVDLWDVASRRRTRFMSLRTASECSAISADGTRAAVGFIDGVVQVWDLTPGPGMLRIADGQEGRTCATLSPDGRLLATGDGKGVLRLWDAIDGHLLAQRPAAQNRLRTIQFSPDGRQLATGSDDEVSLWNLETGVRRAVPGLHRSLSADSLAYSPDGRWLAVPRPERTISLVPTNGTGEERRLGPVETEIVSLRFDPSGEALAVVARDDAIRLFPVGGGDPVALHQVSPWAAAISSDGKRLAAGGWPHEIEVWDLVQRKSLRTLRGHGGLITGLQFMPGEPGMLASADTDGTVRLWDTETGLSLATLDAFEGWESLSLSFSSDGRRLASSGSNGTAVVWDLEYFDRHIAGNAEFQIRALGADAPNPTRLREWVSKVEHRTIWKGAVTGISPDAIAAWGRQAGE
jgi:WD40 repeat protein